MSPMFAAGAVALLEDGAPISRVEIDSTFICQR
jgi:hypothetical protein